MKFIALNTFKINKLVKIVLLNLIFIIYGCGEAVENIEERARLQELSETSVITNISPSFGPTSGGDTLTISGLNLSLVSSISLGDGTCSVVSATDSILTCTTSVASAGSKNVTTFNSKGRSYTFSGGYDYLAPPTITSVTPAIGFISGGETVTITGTGFYQISSITLDGVTCTSPVTASSTVATCTSGAAVAGTGDVVLTNLDAQFVTETNGFTYVNPPSITSFSPTTIIETGSETLTITGSDFDGAASVEIDNFNCPVTFQDATTIQCTTPIWTGLDGQGSSLLAFGNDVNVVVTNSDGGSDTSTIGYLPQPVLTSIDIEFGELAGGDLITLTGDHFITGGSFNISMATVDCATSTVVSETVATCLTDANTAQTGDVVFTNFDGQTATITNGFTYRGPPTVGGVTPTNGPEGGGTTITVTGTGFNFPFTTGDVTVLVGAQPCTNVNVTSATSLSCDTPPNAAGAYSITVTNTEDNQSGVGTTYTYNPAPTITDVTTPLAPFIDYGPLAGGNTIEVQGSNFFAGATVNVDGNPCTSINIVDVNTIECVAPARGSAGLVDVTVTNSDSQSFTLVGSYTYRAPPLITAVSPVAGPTAGGQTLTITGNYMRPNIDIQINGNQCPISNYISDAAIECTTPNNGGVGGPYDVIITNEDTQTATLSTAYEFINPPSVTTSTPTSANPTGGSTINVTGSDFYVAGGINATIDGIDCDSISSLTATSFDCVVPAHGAANDLVIEVTNLVDGQSGSSAAFFDYIPAPTLTNIYESTGATVIDGGNIAGGYVLRLVGENFQAGMTVDIQDDGGSIIGNCGVSDIDNENIDCAIAGGAYPLETVDLIFTNLDGQTSTSTNVFTFREAPTFTSITPDYGVEVTGGNTVRIVGDYFMGSAVVSIDGIDCSSTTFVDTQNLDCVVPPHAAATGLTIEIVNTQDLQSTGAVGSFDYIGPPVVGSLDLASLWEVGGQTLTITGTELRVGATVTIDGNDCPISGGTSPTSLQCTTPAGTGSAVSIVVTNADGQLDNSTIINYLPAPTITSYDYAFGPLTGGNNITITGTGFQTGASVSIGDYGTTAITCSAVDDTGAPTALVCTVPDGTALGLGSHDINIINNDGQVLTDPGAFDYINAPSISSFEVSSTTVTSIYEVGGQTLTVNGSDFRDGLTMTINGNPCPIDTYTDTTLFTCTTPAGSGAAVTVVITNLDGQIENTVPLDYLPAPTITAVQSETDTNGGKSIGGDNVTITGTNFIPGALGTTTITIGGSACGASSITATTIVCLQPAGSGAGDVIVTNPDGQTVTFGTQFDFYPPPSVTSVSPSGGPVTTATPITITGTDFRDNTVAPGGVSVEIGSGNVCTGLVVVNDTTITCTTPALAAGDYNVIVTNGDTESDTLTNGYKFTAAPTITSLSIATAPESLPTALTINGTGFEYYTTPPTVTVDAVACTGITVVDDTQIDCTTAASSNDTTRVVDVVVTNNDGQSATDNTSLTYNARPHVASATPLFGSVAGGTVITITGTSFVSGASVTIGVPCASVDDSGVPTTLVCTTDAAAVGSYDIVVQNPDGQVDDDTTMFGYSNPPVVSSASDGFDVVAGGKTITINGSDFLGVSNVTIGGASCGTINNAGEPTSITCVAPAGSIGEQDIIVTNGDGQTDTLTDGFEYEDTPTFSAISDGVDAAGSDDGGEAVTITGTNFALGVSVTIGGSSCTTLTRVNATTITCTTPAGTIGAADVVISNQSAAATVTAFGAYTYQAEAPTVTSVSPGGGDTPGTETITIIGDNFQATPTVTLDGSTCTSPTFIDAQNITCVTPAHAQGFVDVVVTNPDTNSGTLTNGFLYSDKATIATITPNSGASTGGQTVTVSGANFQDGLYNINIGGVSCGSITHINSGSFTCIIGAQTSGTYDVNISQLFQTDTLSSGFTYANGASLNWIVGASQPTPPNPADWGTQSSNVTYTFTLENNGPTASTSITTSITGTDNTAWVIGTDNCSGTTLNSGASCTVQVTFLAAFLPSGTYSANLEATAVDGGTTINALLGDTP